MHRRLTAFSTYLKIRAVIKISCSCPCNDRVTQIKIPHRTKCNFSTTVWEFYTKISWFIWEILLQFWFKKKYYSFLQNYSYINILCLILNFARNNQQQLVIFIVKKHKTVITNTKIWKVVHFSVCSKCPEPALTQAQSLFGKLNIALLIESCGRWSHINCRTFLSSSMFSGWVEITCSVQA